MKNNPTRRLGFTLVELTIVLMIGMMVSSMVLAIFNQQMAFLRMYRTQSFLNEEAHIVNLYVSKLVGKADRFRLHDSVSDALSNINPRTSDASVCVLNFLQPDGSVRASILAFEDRGDGPALYYYVVPVSGVLADPEWAITDKAEDVEFSMELGILRTRLTGPEGEQITYSGAMD